MDTRFILSMNYQRHTLLGKLSSHEKCSMAEMLRRMFDLCCTRTDCLYELVPSMSGQLQVKN